MRVLPELAKALPFTAPTSATPHDRSRQEYTMVLPKSAAIGGGRRTLPFTAPELSEGDIYSGATMLDASRPSSQQNELQPYESLSKFQVTAIRPPAFSRLVTESAEDEVYELAQFSGLHSAQPTGEDANTVVQELDDEIYDIADRRSRASSRQNTEEDTVDTYVLASVNVVNVEDDAGSLGRCSEATYLTPARVEQASSLGGDEFYPLAAPEDGCAGAEDAMYQFAVAGGKSCAVVEGRPSRHVRTVTTESTGSDQIYAMSTRTRTNDSNDSHDTDTGHDAPGAQGEGSADTRPVDI